ncbi:Pre-rRNA-processing protein ESF2 [Xylariaceae sp. FL0804]|nr:Pre-rRNA-processing protein ESF2 [Xylariaceae sp. FL0804]
MPAEKRNHFLDADESDDDGSQGYDSEAEQIQKGERIAKRRKLDEDADSDQDEVDANQDGAMSEYDNEDEESSRESKAKSEKAGPRSAADLPDVSGPLTKKNLVASEKAVKKSGVVYISRIPPFMKPGTLRKYFERFGKCNRLYLAPEDPQVHSRRVKQGGNRKKNFVEGWIEFVNKAKAKEAVDLLNGQTIGGKKGSYYRDDIWSVVYLKGFKWNNLTEQIASEAAERASRMRAEISKSTKENKEFVRNIEKSKMLDGIQSKATAKKNRDQESADKAALAVDAETDDPKGTRRFKQSSVSTRGTDQAPADAKAMRVFSQLF